MQSLRQLFELQAQLAYKFWTIEGRNGFHTGWDLRSGQLSIENPSGQAVIRRYAWQITEELFEASVKAPAALLSDPKESDFFAFAEEMSDAFHFLLELLIVLRMDQDPEFVEDLEGTWKLFGVQPVDGPGVPPASWSRGFFRFLETLAMTVNLLKNRPWRTDSRPTDLEKFRRGLYLSFHRFLSACVSSGLSHDRLWDAYERKMIINTARTEGQNDQ